MQICGIICRNGKRRWKSGTIPDRINFLAICGVLKLCETVPPATCLSSLTNRTMHFASSVKCLWFFSRLSASAFRLFGESVGPFLFVSVIHRTFLRSRSSDRPDSEINAVIIVAKEYLADRPTKEWANVTCYTEDEWAPLWNARKYRASILVLVRYSKRINLKQYEYPKDIVNLWTFFERLLDFLGSV